VTEAFADVNLFVRLATQDDLKQARAAARVLQSARDGNLLLHITPLVIAEIVWVLSSSYSATKEEIRDFVLTIVGSPGVALEDVEIVLDAITMFVDENVDFSDAYYIAWMRTSGIKEIYTYDKRHFSRFPDIKVKVPH
jgi:predicted nucleic-acid-binding protein